MGYTIPDSVTGGRRCSLQD